jgi:hypothetical protein
MLVNGSEQVKVRVPDDVWIEPGTPVRLGGTMQDGELVPADSASAVKREGPPTGGRCASDSRVAVAPEHGGHPDRILLRRAGA